MSGRGGTKRTRKEKGKATSSSHPPQAQPDPINRFISDEAQDKYIVFTSKKIMYGRVLNANSSFNSFGLHVHSLFAFQNLYRFLALEFPVFPTLIREFYANIHHPRHPDTGHKDRQILCSRVNGIDIQFTEDILGQHLCIPYEQGLKQITCIDDLEHNDPFVVLINALNEIAEEPQTSVENIKTVHLKLPCRVIHRVIINNLRPKSGSQEQVPPLEIYLVWAIWTRRKINWVGLIFAQLGEVKRKDSNLSFGIAISHLLAHLDVPLANQSDIYQLTPHDYFTEGSIRQLGYTIENGQWVPKPRAPPQAGPPPVVRPMVPPHRVPLPAYEQQPQGPSNFDLYNVMRGISQNLDNLRLDVRRIDYRMQSYEDAFHFYHPEYNFPPPPPFGDDGNDEE